MFGVGNLPRALTGLAALMVLCFRTVAPTGWLPSGFSGPYPGLASAGRRRGGGLPFFSLLRLIISSLVGIFISMEAVVYSGSFRSLIPSIWLVSSPPEVSTAGCAGCEVQRGSGGAAIADAGGDPSLAGAKECCGD